MTPTFYAVPTSIAEALRLTRIRKMDSEGYFLLAGFDLQGYGIDKALEQGAVKLTQAEARLRFR